MAHIVDKEIPIILEYRKLEIDKIKNSILYLDKIAMVENCKIKFVNFKIQQLSMINLNYYRRLFL